MLDLIDTLWNVKEKATAGSFGAATGFNRYIVECKIEIARTGVDLAA